jgi:hypothetical protein
MKRTFLQVSIICIYSLVLLFLLLLSMRVGIRIGGNMYAEDGFGPLRSSALVLFLVFLVGGLYLIWRFR